MVRLMVPFSEGVVRFRLVGRVWRLLIPLRGLASMFLLGGRLYWYSVGSGWTRVASANPSRGIGFSGAGRS